MKVYRLETAENEFNTHEIRWFYEKERAERHRKLFLSVNMKTFVICELREFEIEISHSGICNFLNEHAKPIPLLFNNSNP